MPTGINIPDHISLLYLEDKAQTEFYKFGIWRQKLGLTLVDNIPVQSQKSKMGLSIVVIDIISPYLHITAHCITVCM